MAAHIVIENEALGARSLSSPEALPGWEGRGWVAVGGCSDPNREPIRTDAELTAHEKAEAERIAALLNPDAAPAASRSRK
jgi:hypothetical protein